MQTQSAWYDELWRTDWGDMQCVGPVHRHIRRDLLRIVSNLEGCRTILDVGCGSGENLRALASLGRYELTGLDISSQALEHARRAVPTARFHRLDIEKESLPERFDLVISIQAIEHLVDDLAALRHIASMASRYLFISTMSGPMHQLEVSFGHMRHYSPVELRRKLEVAGLDVLDVYGWGFPFYSPLYRRLVRWLPNGAPVGRVGSVGRVATNLIYQLYRLNWPRRGDVLSALARSPR